MFGGNVHLHHLSLSVSCKSSTNFALFSTPFFPASGAFFLFFLVRSIPPMSQLHNAYIITSSIISLPLFTAPNSPLCKLQDQFLRLAIDFTINIDNSRWFLKFL